MNKRGKPRFSGLSHLLDGGTISWVGKTGEWGGWGGTISWVGRPGKTPGEGWLGSRDDFSFGLVRLEESERWRCREGHYIQNSWELLAWKLTRFALVVYQKIIFFNFLQCVAYENTL